MGNAEPAALPLPLPGMLIRRQAGRGRELAPWCQLALPGAGKLLNFCRRGSMLFKRGKGGSWVAGPVGAAGRGGACRAAEMAAAMVAAPAPAAPQRFLAAAGAALDR